MLPDRRRPRRFDTTVNIPTVIAAIGLLGALWSVTIRLEARLTAVETKVEMLLLQDRRYE